jgi:hypothetical protein
VSLADFNISQITAGQVLLFVRDNCMATAGHTAEGSLTLGSTGMMTDKGLAYLVWRDGQALLAAKGSETPADPGQVDTIRKFSDDLKSALHLTE